MGQQPGTAEASTSTAAWLSPVLAILAGILTFACIVFFMVVFFTTPEMTSDQRAVMHLLFGVLAGLATSLWGGAASLAFQVKWPRIGKLSASAGAGIIVFLVTYFYAPYWYERPATAAAPQPQLLYQADFTQFRTTKQPCFEALPSGSDYHIAVTCYQTQDSSLIPETFVNMDMHLTVRQVSGSNRAGYGVLLVAKTASYNRQHRFFVSGVRNYTYEVASYDQSGAQTDLNITKPYTAATVAIHAPGAPNELEVIRKGSVVDFLVNGQRLGSFPTSLSESEEVRPGFQVVTQESGTGDDAVAVNFSKFRIYAVK